MKQTFLSRQHSTRLLLFFAGWGMDENPFRHHPVHCDWMICYDYRSLDFNAEILKSYEEIILIGWSMGVWAASQVSFKLKDLPITERIAINGTPHPIDESYGISPTIYESTFQGLNDVSLQKFQRRMCGSGKAYQIFQQVAPKRSVEDLKMELQEIRKAYQTLPQNNFLWDKAIIGNNDYIFLPINQLRAWEMHKVAFRQVEAAHYQEDLFSSLFSALSLK